MISFAYDFEDITVRVDARFPTIRWTHVPMHRRVVVRMLADLLPFSVSLEPGVRRGDAGGPASAMAHAAALPVWHVDWTRTRRILQPLRDLTRVQRPAPMAAPWQATALALVPVPWTPRPDIRDETSCALSIAARHGRLDVVRLLVEQAGLAPCGRPDAEPPAVAARRAGHGDIAAYLEAAEAKTLSAVAQTELEHATPLAEMVEKIALPLAGDVWQVIDSERHVGSRCLSRMLQRTLAAGSDFRLATNDDRALYGRRIYGLLDAMRQRWPQCRHHQTGFVDEVLALAKDRLGREDSILLMPLSVMLVNLPRFNMKLTEPLPQRELIAIDAARKRIDPVEPFCLSLTAQWGFCKVVDAPFEYGAVSVQEMHCRQHAYQLDNMVHHLLHPDTADGTVECRHIETWARSFTDANGNTYSSSVVVGGPHAVDDVLAYLEQRALTLKSNEVVLLNIIKLSPAGDASGGHVVALSGGATPYDFDAGFGESIHPGSNRPGDLWTYLQECYRVEPDWPAFVITLRPSARIGSESAAAHRLERHGPPVADTADNDKTFDRQARLEQLACEDEINAILDDATLSIQQLRPRIVQILERHMHVGVELRKGRTGHAATPRVLLDELFRRDGLRSLSLTVFGRPLPAPDVLAERIAALLSRNPNLDLVSLQLVAVGFTAAEVASLAEAAAGMRFHSLNLSDNPLGEHGIDELARLLPTLRVHRLELRNCGIGDLSLSKLLGALPHGLRKLSLARNEITDAAVPHIASALRSSDVDDVDLARNALSGRADVSSIFNSQGWPVDVLTDSSR